MLSVAEADALIAAHLPLLPAEDCPLGQAHGRVLRQPVKADRDLPPFDRVTMDGYALSSADFGEDNRTFAITGIQGAGMIPLRVGSPQTCIEIATGAVLPSGADCVVPYEDTRREGNTLTVTRAAPLQPGAQVHRRGSDFPAGASLLTPGVRLTGREIAVAASCGAASLRVSVLPRIAVISTGDELVEVEAATVAAHQIRRSNDHALRAALHQAGFTRVDRVHFRDAKPEIVAGLRQLLTACDALLITGGVSKGKYDYLPSALAELGVEKKFHGVAQRPGKPFWFGLSARRTPVFALPGNPVSTYTCFRRYVLPALQRMSGALIFGPTPVALAEPVTFPPPLTCFLPVALDTDPNGSRRARPLPTNTSGDFASLVGTDGFVELPAEAEAFPAGFIAPFWPW